MSRIGVAQVQLLTRKATFVIAIMTKSHKMVSCHVVDKMNRHGSTGAEEGTKTFPLEVVTVQKARDASRSDAPMRVLR